MADRWSPGPVYTWTCPCGIRMITGDAGELVWLKGQHFVFHAEKGEEA